MPKDRFTVGNNKDRRRDCILNRELHAPPYQYPRTTKKERERKAEVSRLIRELGGIPRC